MLVRYDFQGHALHPSYHNNINVDLVAIWSLSKKTLAEVSGCTKNSEK